MKTKIFLSLASFYACFQCVRPMFYEEPRYEFWWLALTFFFLGVGVFREPENIVVIMVNLIHKIK